MSHERFSSVQNVGTVPGPDIVVVDEAHKIQNPRVGTFVLFFSSLHFSHFSHHFKLLYWQQNNITKALNSVETPLRLAVTGYPVQNRLLDYWSIVNWVNPDRITEVGSVEDFKRCKTRKLYS
jgi:hypothetical protein